MVFNLSYVLSLYPSAYVSQIFSKNAILLKLASLRSEVACFVSKFLVCIK